MKTSSLLIWIRKLLTTNHGGGELLLCLDVDGNSELESDVEVILEEKEVFDYVREFVKENVHLTESVIRQIHYLVLADKKNDRGVYRRVPVRIMGAHNKTVHPYLIEPRME